MLENVRKQMSPAEANKIGVGFGDWAGCLRETGDCSRGSPNLTGAPPIPPSLPAQPGPAGVRLRRPGRHPSPGYLR